MNWYDLLLLLYSVQYVVYKYNFMYAQGSQK